MNVCVNLDKTYVCLLQMEYILRAKRSELTSKLMLSGSDGLGNDLRKMDPETQARLETLLEAAGMLIAHWESVSRSCTVHILQYCSLKL